ncbi:MAG: hypothetical protein LUD15_04570 [Bacteroides sp.]|nr:hypothetical protein [Bacteroides sp.]
MKNHTRQRILCILLFFLTSFSLVRASQLFHHLTEDDELSSRRCFSIRQDKYGYIWISTKLGIDRFDGKNIRQYTTDEKYQRNYGRIGVNNLRLSPGDNI